jgi:hypothetical protein
VRYESDAEPKAIAVCHCTHCQKTSGSAFSVNVMVPAASLKFTGDSLSTYHDHGESGRAVQRKFCRICGSSLASEAEAFPDVVILKAGTLDDRSAAKPIAHIWTASAQAWVKIEEGARAFPKGMT